MKKGYVYIMASKPGGTLYIGVTSILPKRIYEHQNDFAEGFTRKYGCHTLVYYECFDDINEAIVREKQLKKWDRGWKLRLINEYNPEWNNLDIGF